MEHLACSQSPLNYKGFDALEEYILKILIYFKNFRKDIWRLLLDNFGKTQMYYRLDF